MADTSFFDALSTFYATGTSPGDPQAALGYAPGGPPGHASNQYGVGNVNVQAYLNRMVKDIIGGIKTSTDICGWTTNRFTNDFRGSDVTGAGESLYFRLPVYTSSTTGRQLSTKSLVERVFIFTIDGHEHFGCNWNVFQQMVNEYAQDTMNGVPLRSDFIKNGLEKIIQKQAGAVADAAKIGFSQTITVAGPVIGIEIATRMKTYFAQMGIPGDIGYLCDFHTRDDNALSMLGSKINDANVLQNTKNQNSVYATGVDDFKMSNMMLRPTTLLSEHTTGVLFDNGLYNYASLNNNGVLGTATAVQSRTATGQPYALVATSFFPNGPYTQAKIDDADDSDVPGDESKRTTESQLYLWGFVTKAQAALNLGIAESAVPPLLRRGDVLWIEDVFLVNLDSKKHTDYKATFTVMEDVQFPASSATADAGPPNTSAQTAYNVLVKINPSINPGRHQLASDSQPYLAQEQNFVNNAGFEYKGVGADNRASLEEYQNVTKAPVKGARVRIINGLEKMSNYSVEYACPMSSIALSTLAHRTMGSAPFSSKFSYGENRVNFSFHRDGEIGALREVARFDSVYGTKVIIPEYGIKHFVKKDRSISGLL